MSQSKRPSPVDTRPLFFQLSWRQILNAWLVTALLVLLIVSYILEMQRFENTFQVRKLIFTSFAIGAVIGAAAGWWAMRSAKETIEKLQLFMLVFIPVLIFSPLFGSLSNRWLSSEQPVMEQHKIFEIKPVGEFQVLGQKMPENRDFKVYFLRDKTLEYIRLKNLPVDSLQKGDTLNLLVGQGLWGIDYLIKNKS